MKFMRIIFFGTPEFAVPALEILIKNGFEILNLFTQDGEEFTWINVYARKK